ncbi:MAG: hypothetical protein ABH805_00170 [Candidatus Nealsonbacteria bacterium]
MKKRVALVCVLCLVLLSPNLFWFQSQGTWLQAEAILEDQVEGLKEGAAILENYLAASENQVSVLESQLTVSKNQMTVLENQLAEKASQLQEERGVKKELFSQNLNLQEELEALEQQRKWWLGRSDNDLIADIEKELLITGVVNEASVEVKPVMFYPKDSLASDTAEQKEEIERSLSIVQQYFILKVGETFVFSEPVVVQGKRSEAGYDKLSPEIAAEVILNELPSLPAKTYYLVFALKWSPSPQTNYAFFFKGAVMEEWTTRAIVNGNSLWRYEAMGLIVHELGHVFLGLPDIVTKESTMMGHTLERFYWSWNFPSVDFSPKEKDRLKKYLE